MKKFKAEIKIIGINPYVSLSRKMLDELFKDAGKDKGPIPIKGAINDKPYKQTLMKFKGEWRLYINTIMLKDSPKRIGETIEMTVQYDPAKRTITPHPSFIKALSDNKSAKDVFDNLSPSRKNEIVRYISNLKTEESINRNVAKAIGFLKGKSRFVGRDKP
ncbi:MAG: hypothetical protein K0Q95_1678 [Bacteroidota bacterium]|jgi:hypothetical protein|nr:hypothetical protein [Bacteroidota bacterium]